MTDVNVQQLAAAAARLARSLMLTDPDKDL